MKRTGFEPVPAVHETAELAYYSISKKINYMISKKQSRGSRI